MGELRRERSCEACWPKARNLSCGTTVEHCAYARWPKASNVLRAQHWAVASAVYAAVEDRLRCTRPSGRKRSTPCVLRSTLSEG